MFPSKATEQTNASWQGSWLAPVLALAFAVLFVVGFATGSSSSEPDTPGAEVIAKHAQGGNTTFIAGTALIVAAIMLIFFGGWLRQMLRSKAALPDWLPDVVFAGAIVHAVTLAIFVSAAKSVQDGISTGDPVVAQTLNIADGNNFVTAMVGLACMLIATGVSAYRSGALPRWLAIVSIILGVMAPLGPGGFAPFLSFPIWVVLVAFIARPRPVDANEVTVRTTTAMA